MALIQTEKVAQQLRQLYPALAVEFLPLSTKGDQIQDRSLAQLGGKGLFIKTLEEALQRGQADMAIHSLKDVPPHLEAPFALAAVMPRLSAFDVLVSNQGTLDQLPAGALIGTCSVRRTAELLHYRPDLKIAMVRGNVNTRLQKLDAGLYDALILGQAGLMHLGMTERITEVLSPELFLPSVGQGVIAIEILKDRQELRDLLAPLNDPDTFACISAERSMNAHLGARCTSPVGSFATINKGILTLRGAVFSLDGKTKISTEQQGRPEEISDIASRAATALLQQGAQALFQEGTEHE